MSSPLHISQYRPTLITSVPSTARSCRASRSISPRPGVAPDASPTDPTATARSVLRSGTSSTRTSTLAGLAPAATTSASTSAIIASSVSAVTFDDGSLALGADQRQRVTDRRDHLGMVGDHQWPVERDARHISRAHLRRRRPRRPSVCRASPISPRRAPVRTPRRWRRATCGWRWSRHRAS